MRKRYEWGVKKSRGSRRKWDGKRRSGQSMSWKSKKSSGKERQIRRKWVLFRSNEIAAVPELAYKQ